MLRVRGKELPCYRRRLALLLFPVAAAVLEAAAMVTVKGMDCVRQDRKVRDLNLNNFVSQEHQETPGGLYAIVERAN